MTLAGRVFGRGNHGLPGALVELEAPRRAIRTATDGSFAFGDLPNRYPFELRASAPGFAPASKRVTSRKVPVYLALHPPRDVAGVVRDPTGRAVSPEALALEADHDTFRGATDAAGAFLIRAVPAGSYRLLIDALGFATWYEPVQIPPGNGVFRLPAIALQPASPLYGHVEDKGGNPVADVEIFIRRHDERLSAGGVFRRQPDARSGTDGSFRLDNLAGGATARLVLQHDGYSPLEAEVDPRRADDNAFVLEAGVTSYSRFDERMDNQRRASRYGACRFSSAEPPIFQGLTTAASWLREDCGPARMTWWSTAVTAPIGKGLSECPRHQRK